MPPGYPIGGVTAYGNLMSDYWYPYSDAPARGQASQSYYYERTSACRSTDRGRAARAAQAAALRDDDVRLDRRERRAGRGRRARHDRARSSWSAGRYEEHARTRAVRRRLRRRPLAGAREAGHRPRRRDFDQRMVLAVFRSKELHEG